MGMSNTMSAVEKKGQVIAATLVLAAILFSFAGFTYLTMKKTHKRGVTITYAVMLFISLLIFGGIAFAGPHVRGKKKDTT
jgi:glucan phosphoethanolaminetransferase (alkaline phosphatase superfamily)